MSLQNTVKHDPNKPLVSVVIPVYNVEAYIEQALSSVLAQTYTHLEIIIIDDQTPDKSIERIEHNFNDQRIKIIQQKNRGLAGARNTGIRHAHGQFVALLDSDDFWAKDKIEKHMDIMLKNPNCGLSFCASRFVDKDANQLKHRQAPKKNINYKANDIFCRNPIGNGSAPVIRKSILEQIGFQHDDKTKNGEPYIQYFNESLKQSEDIDCWTRMSILTATDFHFIDEELTFYRLIDNSLSADVETQFSTWMTLLENLEHYAPSFAKKYGPTAKSFQYRYLARRSLFQGNAKNALTFMWLALKTKPTAMLYEVKKTAETITCAIVLTLLPHKVQLSLMKHLV